MEILLWEPSLLTLAGVVLTVVGAVVGSVLTNRVARRAAETVAIATQKSGENQLIDQLQEELGGHRKIAEDVRQAADRRATVQDERMNRLDKLASGYRDHAHELRSHIYDGKPPPPPDWPPNLPR